MIRSLQAATQLFRKMVLAGGRIRTNRCHSTHFVPWAEDLENRLAPATFNVLNLMDNAAGAPVANSLRAAVAGVIASNDATNDIIFAGNLSGNISLQRALPNISKSVNIVQGLGPITGRVTVTRGVAQNFRIFTFNQVAAGSTVLISGINIDGGAAPQNQDGGGIYIRGLNEFNLQLYQVYFTNNRSSLGGGAVAAWGANQDNITVSGCRFIDNQSSGNGPGSVGSGGAILAQQVTQVTISNSLFRRNTSQNRDGGAVYAPSVTVTDSQFNNSTAGRNGGAIYGSGDIQISRTSFSTSTALNGAALYVTGGSTGTVTDCSVDGGSAVRGGAIYDAREGLNFINNTMSNNSATDKGGAIYVDPEADGNGFIANCIFAGNSASNDGPDVYGTINSAGYNVIGKTNGSSGWIGSDLTGTAGSPLDPKLNPVGYYGNNRQTMTLQADSPAINAGDNTYAASADERGFTRVVNSTIDIGADEMQSGETSLTAPYAYNVTFTVGYNGSLTVPAEDGDSNLLDYSGNDPLELRSTRSMG